VVGHEAAWLPQAHERASARRSCCRETPAPEWYSAALAIVFSLAMVWYMWWLAVASFISLVAYAIHHTFNYDREFHLAAKDVIHCEDDARITWRGLSTTCPIH
jgi:hypothetical protein